jgi:hypothetical protein
MVLFCDKTCKIFDVMKKLIGVIPVKKGLYRESAHTASKATEMLTLEELHRRMGHIAPDTARHLVTEGAIEGIKLGDSSMLQMCTSCEYCM